MKLLLGYVASVTLIFGAQSVSASPIRADAVPSLVITFDSTSPTEALTTTISGKDSAGLPVALIATPPAAMCAQLLADLGLVGPSSTTQCGIFDPAKFPNGQYDAAVNFLEGDGTISDTLQVHVKTFQTPLGSVFVGIIKYETDSDPGGLLGILGATPAGETGFVNDVTGLFPGLPGLLLPPTAADPHTFAPLTIMAGSDAAPEPASLILLGTGLLGAYRWRKQRHSA